MRVPEVLHRDDVTELLRSMKAKRVCEVGVLRGAGLRRLNVPTVELIVGVDTWTPYEEKNDYDLDRCYQQARKVQRELKKAVLLRVDSAVAADFFVDDFFDFVYIDANHAYDCVLEDLTAWWPKVKRGGVFSGHDYVEGSRFGDEFGVIPAVNRFVAHHKLKLHLTVDKYKSWLVEKPA